MISTCITGLALKENCKSRKGAAFWKQPFDTLKDVILICSSILLAVLASIKLLPVRTIAYHMCLLLNSSWFWNRCSWESCSIKQRSSLWQKSTAGSYYYCYEEFHLICGRALDPPLKSRYIKVETISSFSSVWLSHTLTDNHLSFPTCCID